MGHGPWAMGNGQARLGQGAPSLPAASLVGMGCTVALSLMTSPRARAHGEGVWRGGIHQSLGWADACAEVLLLIPQSTELARRVPVAPPERALQSLRRKETAKQQVPILISLRQLTSCGDGPETHEAVPEDAVFFFSYSLVRQTRTVIITR